MLIRRIILIVMLGGFGASSLFAWGFEAHRKINRAAVSIVPGPLGDFLKEQESWVVDLSTSPDLRRQYFRPEGPAHYIDFEYYPDSLLSQFPRDRREAEEKYGQEKLPEWGFLPWHLAGAVNALKSAFEKSNWSYAVVLMAEIGHYVADGHMPLHTTANYNGQLSGNDGVHHLFETSLVNHYYNEAILTPSLPVQPITAEGLPDSIFAFLWESFGYVDEVLAADSFARKGMKDTEMLRDSWKTKPGDLPQRYLRRLNQKVGGLALSRMTQAAGRIAAIWLWAWNAAGQPEPPQ